MPAGITDQASYIAWLDATGKPACSRYHGYAANYQVYRDYKLLSYGTPQMVPGNRYDSATGQYAMHGFSYDEYTLTTPISPMIQRFHPVRRNGGTFRLDRMPRFRGCG